MFFDLLHFGNGPQAINYFILCFFALLGTIQFVAVRYQRRDLLWFGGQVGYSVSALLIVGSFVWFFVTDQEIFIPGLAGGELFTIFIAAFIGAVPVTRLVAFALGALNPRREAKQIIQYPESAPTPSTPLAMTKKRGKEPTL